MKAHVHGSFSISIGSRLDRLINSECFKNLSPGLPKYSEYLSANLGFRRYAGNRTVTSYWRLMVVMSQLTNERFNTRKGVG